MNRLDATLSLTKLLSVTYNEFEELKIIVQFSPSEWEYIIEVANRYMLVPALYASIQRKGLLVYIDNQQLIDFMKEIYTLNVDRNIAILKQINEICQILDEIEVKPILLKGAAALSEQHYSTIGQRAMMDIDILVPQDKIFECIDLLKSKGEYKELNESSKLYSGWHHYRRLYKDSGMASLELHRYAIHSKKNYFPKELAQEHILQSLSVENASVIKPVYELYHSFLHTQISHHYHGDKFLALRHMHHFSVMLEKYKNIQWDELTKLVKNNNLTEIWEEYLFVVQSMFKADIPLNIKKSKSNNNYLKAVYKEISLYGSKQTQIKVFFNELRSSFSYKKLSTRYDFSNKFLLFVYVPKRVIDLLYSYAKDSKKIISLIDNIKHMSGSRIK